MGLDITHYKATLEKAEDYTLFYIGQGIYGETGGVIREKFEGFNVDFNHFSKYIQEIDFPTEIESVVIVKGNENLKEVQEHFRSTERIFLVRENEEQLQKTLSDFERNRGYENLKKCFEDIDYMDWIILRYYTVEKKEGFYFKSVGEQRKGMNGKFYQKFCKGNQHMFAHKSDFDYALTCVDHYWEGDSKERVRQRKEEFKKYFVDNFESGASFMFVSY
ncbi:hypothetical protein POV27_04080 [Aureisphaera galaxeae]|uniref:hypothetical protein n=1 Tax=Aureisphaera galaxeae TaxID=1538023 RepID=UPI00235083DB|nr:hypothetical protein [Aureisphaera galaxeae]MDC8003213.1 hypothetical protein [Aureisphaera galaxeae]